MSNCYIEVRSGAFGRYSRAWSEDISLMYRKCAERHGFSVKRTLRKDGESLEIIGSGGYFLFKNETGMHFMIKSRYRDPTNRYCLHTNVKVDYQLEEFEFEPVFKKGVIRIYVFNPSPLVVDYQADITRSKLRDALDGYIDEYLTIKNSRRKKELK